MLFWVRVTGLDVGSAIYLGCLKDASWGLPRAGCLELSTHFVGGHRRPEDGGKHQVTPALQKQACHFTPRNLLPQWEDSYGNVFFLTLWSYCENQIK